jgi:hypothetical protein
VTEKAWMEQVVELATHYRWRHMHILDSRGSDAGWPDLMLARAPELLAAELKTDNGRLSTAQRDWLALLAACGIETHVWRPRDFDEVHARLRRR